MYTSLLTSFNKLICIWLSVFDSPQVKLKKQISRIYTLECTCPMGYHWLIPSYWHQVIKLGRSWWNSSILNYFFWYIYMYCVFVYLWKSTKYFDTIYMYVSSIMNWNWSIFNTNCIFGLFPDLILIFNI